MTLFSWFWCEIAVIGAIGILFGLFNAFWPERSIVLYQWIMARLNWRVSPINETHEIRMTRILGTVLVLLSLALGVILFL